MSEWGRMGPQLPDQKRLEILEEHEADMREAAAQAHLAHEVELANGRRPGVLQRLLARLRPATRS